MAWPEAADYQRAAWEEVYRCNLHGRAEVHLDDRGERMFQAADDWIDLPFTEAIETFKARMPILSKDAHRILSDALKQKAWTIAGDHSDYTREVAKESLQEALEDGWSKRRWIDFAKENGIPNLGDHHLETVFDTNILSSYQHGRWKQQHTPNLIKRRPFMTYRTVGDERVRDNHAALDGFTARRDHPAWASIYPPGGFRCRCRCDILRQSGVDRMKQQGTIKKVYEPSEGLPSIEVNGKQVKGGPDKGWDTNPGEWLKEPGESQRKSKAT